MRDRIPEPMGLLSSKPQLNRALRMAIAFAALRELAGCDLQEDDDLERGEARFTQKYGTCHALTGAGSNAEVGPNLHEVLAGRSRDQIARSILKPDAQIAPGFQPGVIPQNYGEVLTPQEAQQVVRYLQQSIGV